MHPRTRLVYFYFFRVNFLVKASTSGRCDQVWLPWQRCICRSRYRCFCLSPQVTYLHTKIEGGLKFFISNFASLSWRIAPKCSLHNQFEQARRQRHTVWEMHALHRDVFVTVYRTSHNLCLFVFQLAFQFRKPDFLR